MLWQYTNREIFLKKMCSNNSGFQPKGKAFCFSTPTSFNRDIEGYLIEKSKEPEIMEKMAMTTSNSTKIVPRPTKRGSPWELPR